MILELEAYDLSRDRMRIIHLKKKSILHIKIMNIFDLIYSRLSK